MRKYFVPAFSTMLIITCIFCQKSQDMKDEKRKEYVAVERMLMKMEEEWINVFISRDVSVLDSLLAPNFICHYGNGHILTKYEEMDRFVNGQVDYSSVLVYDLKLHLYDRILGVITGAVRRKGRNDQGKSFEHDSRWTHIWLKKKGQWQCIVGHENTIPEE